VQRHADADTDHADRDRAQHMAEAAQAGDPEGLAGGPTAGRRHRDERQVVIRTEQRMDEADGRGRQDQQAEIDGHGRANSCVCSFARKVITPRGPGQGW
jgi:hypothetical protein